MYKFVFYVWKFIKFLYRLSNNLTNKLWHLYDMLSWKVDFLIDKHDKKGGDNNGEA